jgi:ParB/RepB/Spo0J family partition protein
MLIFVGEEMTETVLKHVLLEDIHEPTVALRGVDKSQEAYVGLVESIKLNGILCPISIREIEVPETGETIYGLADGLQRLNAAKDAGLASIPCQVISCEDGKLIETQIMANVHKIETKPVQYSKALLTILQNNPLMTRSELAASLAKTPSWISERLGLLKLEENIGKTVDEGVINLSNAYALAKLPQEEQHEFVDRAISMTPANFTPVVNARVKELRDAKRKGRDAAPEEFQAVPLLRSRKDMVCEMEAPSAGPALCDECSPETAPAAFALGVLWALNLDPQSVLVQKANDDERRANKAKAKEASSIERKKKRAKEASEKAVELKREAEEAVASKS